MLIKHFLGISVGPSGRGVVKGIYYRVWDLECCFSSGRTRFQAGVSYETDASVLILSESVSILLTIGQGLEQLVHVKVGQDDLSVGSKEDDFMIALVV